MSKINGGFYLKAKCVQSSYIAHAPPCTREIWDWLLMRAMHKDGKDLKRGQLICTYKDIQDGLHWYVGYRKMAYSKWDCERAMKALVKATMITTTKTTRGLVVSIVNYAKYQDIKNYESHNESHNEATMKPQTTDTIEKEVKELKEIKEETKRERTSLRFVPPSLQEIENYCLERKNRISPQGFFDFYESKGWMIGKNRMKDWRAAIRTWERKEHGTQSEDVSASLRAIDISKAITTEL
ncbi:MAG: hypothetical protein GYA69_05225 [Candidatus Moranbacteria bacterium]|nr:hypothetical protein [Candidatus Moranbacteria bacterium]